MIWESWPWEKRLLEMTSRLRDCKRTENINEELLAQVEQDIFIGFYSVRKLIETTTKVTDSIKSMKIQVGWHPNLEHVNWLNNHKLEKLYDLEKLNKETRDILFVCGRIIHSFIFTLAIDDDGLFGILFTSDTDKDKKLYSLELDEVINIFEQVGHDDPKEVKWEKDLVTGEEKTVVK